MYACVTVAAKLLCQVEPTMQIVILDCEISRAVALGMLMQIVILDCETSRDVALVMLMQIVILYCEISRDVALGMLNFNRFLFS